jgi:RNA polymerase sigma-70 factor (ECF subfamily)
MGARITAALRALPERQRAVFVLRHYEDMSLEEIGRTLDLRLGTVKSSLHRAIQGLRQRLEGLRA